MGQSIQEWTKQILWKTTFKKIEGIWSVDKMQRKLMLNTTWKSSQPARF